MTDEQQINATLTTVAAVVRHLLGDASASEGANCR